MKKVLIATTALVAATVASGAQASEKIKLELGGYSKWWVVGAWQENSFQSATQGDYNSVDVKGDNEVFFDGSTKLDNGLEVGVHIELEAGGVTEDRTDPIDKSNVYISGGFGKFIVGTEDNGAVLLHVMAPDAATNTDSDGILTGGLAIAAPSGFTNRVVTSIDTDGQAEKITYVAPTFYGLTLGATYVPNTKEDDRGATKINSTNVAAADIYGVGALYANTFGGVGVKVSGGWATYNVEGDGSSTFVNGSSEVNEYSVGTQLSYAGFTLGGSYRKVNSDQNLVGTVAASGTVWDAGIQYASGPYAISFIYFDSKADRTATLEDEFSVYQVSGKYALGPGVDVLATVGHADYDSGATGNANSNKGWAVMTGLSLTF